MSSPSILQAAAEQALQFAKSRGSTAADVEVSTSVGQNITVRLNEVETIEHNRDKGLGITVYLGQQRGNASTTDLSAAAIERTVDAALAIAKYTAADEFAGLADPLRLAKPPYAQFDLYHPWLPSIDDAVSYCREMEAAAFAVDKRIDNSEGATLSTYESDFIYANSSGFLGGYATTRHSASVTMIATSPAGMQRDYWYSVSRSQKGLETPASIGRRAGQRTLSRLNAMRVPTCDAPVIFDATLAPGLIGAFVSAVSGSSLYRKASFLLDSAGTAVFAKSISIYEDPFVRQGLASGPFDSEGVATTARDVVKEGVLQGYFLSTYSARKLGLSSTGNAGGNHNLIVTNDNIDLAALLKKMGRGLYVTETMGHGSNNVTGDYSLGAAGFWIENGEIQFPVEEITIAGNLRDMFKGIVAIGNDHLPYGSKQVGSILIDHMAIAGE
ncbi:MAG: metalloprotease PmbA [Pseudomonadota bacterium]